MACVTLRSYVHTGPKAPTTLHQVKPGPHSAVERRAQVSCHASRSMQTPSIVIIGVCGRARSTPVRQGCLCVVEPAASIGATMQHGQLSSTAPRQEDVRASGSVEVRGTAAG